MKYILILVIALFSFSCSDLSGVDLDELEVSEQTGDPQPCPDCYKTDPCVLYGTCWEEDNMEDDVVGDDDTDYMQPTD